MFAISLSFDAIDAAVYEPKIISKGYIIGYKHNIGHIELEDQKLSENSAKI